MSISCLQRQFSSFHCCVRTCSKNVRYRFIRGLYRFTAVVVVAVALVVVAAFVVVARFR